MKSRILFAIAATSAMSTSVFAADLYNDSGYNWGGFYGGVSAGVSGSNSNAKADYNDGTGRGWSDNGMFSTDAVVDDFYDTSRPADWDTGSTDDWEHNGTTLSSATGSLTGYDNTSSGITTGAPGFDPLTPWLTILDNDNLNGAGSVRIGANYQVGMFVLGAEADGSLLLNELVIRRDLSESASLNTSNVAYVDNFDGTPGPSNEYGYNWDSECDGQNPGSSEDACSYNTSYSATYGQDGEFGYRSSIESLVTVRGRAGFAAGRALFFATGGLAVGQIKMSTSSHTSEQSDTDWSGTARVDQSGGGVLTQATDDGSSTVSANTSWDASNSKTAYGYAVGGGVSFAVTDNLIWTSDGYYYDLGRHSITATDNGSATSSSYTISQRFDGYVVRTGMEWKF